MPRGKKAAIDVDEIGEVTSEVLEGLGLMDALGDAGECPCHQHANVSPPRYKSGTFRARRAASNRESFILETKDNGDIYVDRIGQAFKLEADGTARERVGRVSEFIEVPPKMKRVKKKVTKKRTKKLLASKPEK